MRRFLLAAVVASRQLSEDPRILDDVLQRTRPTRLLHPFVCQQGQLDVAAAVVLVVAAAFAETVSAVHSSFAGLVVDAGARRIPFSPVHFASVEAGHYLARQLSVVAVPLSGFVTAW